uniref:E3 ubiquitin-protein ligase RHF2A-like n=1 Tax=Erigeron canadensis TaxID=72917 RepID=UPI001CB97906|nr:E3 ubiquitin-protein ligase RHF2A-like [Erigeron canadensis]XP_043630688.1 E3 ubiquitin-protein ligase RHF2A-like [Erigeron canadensis]
MEEVQKMEEGKSKSHLISPAAFVEGGIQEACEDSCSICLEGFCDNDPGTVTSCKHEFHLQCILEWCQRSSNCPMCWQAISLKDPSSQELLEAVEHERRVRFNPPRTSTIFHHPTLGDFELQHLPVGVNDSELEDRIIQHLAAAAAMGRTHHVGRREGSRNRSAAHSRPQFLVFSTNPNAPPAVAVSASSGSVQVQAEPVDEPTAVDSPRASALYTGRGGGTVQHTLTSGRTNTSDSQHGTSVIHRSSGSVSSPPDQDRAGPSEMQTPSDTWKSKFSAISTRYKESLSKSTRGWKDKLFNKSPSMSSIGSEVRREVNAGIANMSRMIERLEVQDNNSEVHDHDSPASNLAEQVSDAGGSNHNRIEIAGAHGGLN